MLSEEKPKYSYNDVMIEPSSLSCISSRSEINLPAFLPIFTAPMSTVVGEKSWNHYQKNRIIPILPRNYPLEKRLEYLKKGYWVAMSLDEFTAAKFSDGQKVLIDIANGHMVKLFALVSEKKKQTPGLVVMAGNIANPETIRECCNYGIDYVRVGIGGGSGCITSSNTGIGYPMASLINETRILRDKLGNFYKYKTKIIADGGIRGYSDIIKALALGADYVMIGGLFAGCLEAEGSMIKVVEDNKYKEEGYTLQLDENGIEGYDIIYSCGGFNGLYRREREKVRLPVTLSRTFYGMASKFGQADISGSSKKTAEGIVKKVPITITLGHWVENMESYLRSAMSYCDCKELEDMYRKMKCIPISTSAQLSINK